MSLSVTTSNVPRPSGTSGPSQASVDGDSQPSKAVVIARYVTSAATLSFVGSLAAVTVLKSLDLKSGTHEVGNELNKVEGTDSLKHEVLLNVVQAADTVGLDLGSSSDAHSYVNQALSSLRDCNMAGLLMVQAKSTVDSVATLIEMGTGYKVPRVVQVAARALAVTSVAYAYECTTYTTAFLLVRYGVHRVVGKIGSFFFK